MSFRFLSLFSGIEAASVAWKPLGWECVAVAEVEPFPCSVLAHHYPGVPNLGDVTKITQEQIQSLGNIDAVVFGFPCQDLSIVGKRAGLHKDGKVTRSGLFFDAMRIVRWSAARWAIAENVPGLFSHGGGLTFAAVAGEMAGVQPDVPQGGWQNSGFLAGPKGLVEWAVLDAQFFGVPQRRRRVFLVLDSGDWAGRPPLLLDRESLLGNPPPRREARQRVAGGVEVGPSGGRLTDCSPTLDARCKDGFIRNQLGIGVLHADTEEAFTLAGHGIYSPGTGPLRREGGDCGGGSENLVAHLAR